MSIWQQCDVLNKIREIMLDIHNHRPQHHFPSTFVSSYQIAIEMDKRFPQVRQALGPKYEIGGKGLGKEVSLSQYVARELSRRINSGEIDDIEGAFLSNLHLIDVEFDNSIHSSVVDNAFGNSIFRLRLDD